MWDSSGFHLGALSHPFVHWLLITPFTRLFCFIFLLRVYVLKREGSPCFCPHSGSGAPQQARWLPLITPVSSTTFPIDSLGTRKETACVTVSSSATLGLQTASLGNTADRPTRTRAPAARRRAPPDPSNARLHVWKNCFYLTGFIVLQLRPKRLENERKPVPLHHLAYSFVGFFFFLKNLFYFCVYL